MPIQTLFLALFAGLSLLLLLPLLLLLTHGTSRRVRGRQLTAQANATIYTIAVKASTFGCGWIVTAQAFNPQNGQYLTFESSRLEFRPPQHVGDQILVHYDSKHPHRSRMEI